MMKKVIKTQYVGKVQEGHLYRTSVYETDGRYFYPTTMTYQTARKYLESIVQDVEDWPFTVEEVYLLEKVKAIKAVPEYFLVPTSDH